MGIKSVLTFIKKATAPSIFVVGNIYYPCTSAVHTVTMTNGSIIGTNIQADTNNISQQIVRE